jgi:hypothetical protein
MSCCLCVAAVAVNAGCEALPALLNIKQVMIQRQVSYSAFFNLKGSSHQIRFGRKLYFSIGLE